MGSLATSIYSRSSDDFDFIGIKEKGILGPSITIKKSEPKKINRRQKVKTLPVILPENAPFPACPNLVPFDDDFDDSQGIRILKIFKEETIFPDLPEDIDINDVEFRSTVSKSVKSGIEPIRPNLIDSLPESSEDIMQKFLADLDSTEIHPTTSTQQMEEEVDVLPLFGSSQPFSSQGAPLTNVSSIQQGTSSQNLKKKSKKKHLVGF